MQLQYFFSQIIAKIYEVMTHGSSEKYCLSSGYTGSRTCHDLNKKGYWGIDSVLLSEPSIGIFIYFLQYYVKVDEN